MRLTDEFKILDDKIKLNQVQYDLDRKAVKISVLSSKELDKCEYLTGKDLGYKTRVLEKAKFEHSGLGKVFNKGLDEKNKKEGLLNRLKKIEDKNERLKTIKDQGEKQLKILTSKTDKHVDFKNVSFKNELNPESIKASKEIKK